MLVQIR